MPIQFGFRENYSTTLAITHLYDQILKEHDKNNVVGCIVLDIVKASDTVNHNILLYKLEQYGIRGIANKLIRFFLTNRTQTVSGTNFCSPPLNIKIGVPQGSVLGPKLFLLYINDLAECSKFNVIMYADDSFLTCARKTALKCKNL